MNPCLVLFENPRRSPSWALLTDMLSDTTTRRLQWNPGGCTGRAALQIPVLLPTGCVYIYLSSACMPHYQLYNLAAARSQTHCPVVPRLLFKASFREGVCNWGFQHAFKEMSSLYAVILVLDFGNANLSLVSVCSSIHSQACDSHHYSNCKQKLDSSLHIKSLA